MILSLDAISEMMNMHVALPLYYNFTGIGSVLFLCHEKFRLRIF